MRAPTSTPAPNIEISRFKAARKAGDLAVSMCSYLSAKINGVVRGQAETPDADLRSSSWVVAPAPRALANRRIEIMGGASREAVEAGLASGANVYVADLSDSGRLEWGDLVAVVGDLAALAVGSGRLDTEAILMVRPRRLTAVTRGPEGAGEVCAGILDAVLFASLCAERDVDVGRIYLYLPDLSSRREARLWNTVLDRLETALELAPHSIVTTPEVSSPAGVEHVEEILWELRRRSVALSVRYRDEILGVIAPPTVAEGAGVSRGALREVVATCNRRGASAICGVRDEIPLKPGVDSALVKLSRVVLQTREFAIPSV